MENPGGHPAKAPAPSPRPAWHALHLWQIQPLRDAMLLAAILGLLYVGYMLSTVTVPLLLALLLAYLFEPLVRYLTVRFKVTRNFVAVLIIVCAGLAVVVPAGLGLTFGVLQGTRLAEEQLTNVQSLIKSLDKPEDPTLREALPSQRWKSLRDWLVEQQTRARINEAMDAAKRAALDPAGAKESQLGPDMTPPQGTPVPAQAEGQGGVIEQSMSGAVAELTTRAVAFLRANTAEIGKGAYQLSANLLSSAWGVVTTLFRLGTMAFFTGFFFFFFCRSWGSVTRFWQGLVPDDRKSRVFHLVSKMDRVVAGFVRGRLTICAIQMVLFTAGTWIIGCPAPLIVGPLVGLLTLVPYAAGLIGMPIVMLLMALNPDAPEGFRSAWWWIVGAPLVLQIISQVLDDYFLSPAIQGKNTDLSMPIILFASISGGILAGFYGLLVAIPVAACAKIIFEEVIMPKVKAWAKGEAQDPLPIGRD
ncbi:MAG: AI-2E family transporter [Phycisphaerales bacterium]